MNAPAAAAPPPPNLVVYNNLQTHRRETLLELLKIPAFSMGIAALVVGVISQGRTFQDSIYMALVIFPIFVVMMLFIMSPIIIRAGAEVLDRRPVLRIDKEGVHYRSAPFWRILEIPWQHLHRAVLLEGVQDGMFRYILEIAYRQNGEGDLKWLDIDVTDLSCEPQQIHFTISHGLEG
jgi:hypothetical protein